MNFYSELNFGYQILYLTYLLHYLIFIKLNHVIIEEEYCKLT